MTKKTRAPKQDVYQLITDQIIEQLEAGVLPWVKPWGDKTKYCSYDAPHNAITGREYNGINNFILSMASTAYGSTQWLTFKQAADIGANVIKGQKGTKVVFFSKVKGKEATADEEAKRGYGFLKQFTVFNITQCENVDSEKLAKKIAAEHAPDPETAAYSFAVEAGANVSHGGNQAFFRPSQDLIKMPFVDQFKTVDMYASTLLHELTHWTGHKNRLDREKGVSFGDDVYAKEELIAELGSMFLCTKLGIQLEFSQHAAYIDSWLRVLKADKKAIFSAAAAAQRSTDYLLEITDTQQQAA